MLTKIREFIQNHRGAVLTEYVIILAFIAALAVAIGLNSGSDSLKGTATTTATNAKSDLNSALGKTN
jgi:Flp pilus assembly pilin Flp